MKNYLLVPDKFKGSLSAKEVINALKKGILKAEPDANLFSALVSDGGDGFMESVAYYTNAEVINCKACNSLGLKIEAPYLLDKSSNAAYIEMARTAGLEMLGTNERNPLYTSTYGTGLQIKHALENGAKNIYVGIGGSATNDAGMGIAVALGYEFLDQENSPLEPIGDNLLRVKSIVQLPMSQLYSEAKIYAINDVNNPLFGLQGAAYVYAAQKGASEDEIAYLDKGLQHLDALVYRDLGISNSDVPGAGAAGGTAYGLMTFLGARFIGGTAFVLNLAGVPELIRDQAIDCIITGEGKIDHQTLRGKLIHGILELGKDHDIPVVGICGALDADKEALQEAGLADILEIRDKSQTLAFNMENAAELIETSIYSYLTRKN